MIKLLLIGTLFFATIAKACPEGYRCEVETICHTSGNQQVCERIVEKLPEGKDMVSRVRRGEWGPFNLRALGTLFGIFLLIGLAEGLSNLSLNKGSKP